MFLNKSGRLPDHAKDLIKISIEFLNVLESRNSHTQLHTIIETNVTNSRNQIKRHFEIFWKMFSYVV